MRKDENDEWTSNDPAVVKIMAQARLLIRDVGFPIVVVVFVALVYTGYLHSPLTDMLKSLQDQQTQTAMILQQHATMIQNEENVASSLATSDKESEHRLNIQLAVLKRICRNVAQNENQRALCDDPDQYLRSPGESINEYGARPS